MENILIFVNDIIDSGLLTALLLYGLNNIFKIRLFIFSELVFIRSVFEYSIYFNLI